MLVPKDHTSYAKPNSGLKKTSNMTDCFRSLACRYTVAWLSVAWLCYFCAEQPGLATKALCHRMVERDFVIEHVQWDVSIALSVNPFSV